MTSKDIKPWMAIVAFICAIAFGVAGFCCPPLSIIDSSVLYFTGQIFLFTATMLGVNLTLPKVGSNQKNYRGHNDESDDN